MSSVKPAFVGIDLAFAKKKRLPIAVCTWRDGRLVPEPLRLLPLQPPRGHGNAAVLLDDVVDGFVDDAAQYIVGVCEHLGLELKQIAIDAPSAPRLEGARRRAAELAIDRAGISCFATPTITEFDEILAKVRRHLLAGGAQNRIPHANQLWMLVGFRLFERLSQLAPCIEVFPQATARVLGSGAIHKFKAGGVEAQLLEAARHTGWPSGNESETRFEDLGFGPAHDRLDAYLSAWVAALEPSRRVPFGDAPHDVIWAPRVGHVAFESPAPRIVRNRTKPRSIEPSTIDHRRACPACGSHEFKRWPFGWDAHAAHKCSGVVGGNAEERKRDFKDRFGHTFPGADP